MTTTTSNEAAESIGRLGQWASHLTWDTVPTQVQERLALVLLNTLGVTALGHQQPEQQNLVKAWPRESGRSPLVGGGQILSLDAAAWLNATASVRLELDEGNKFAKGHPSAHGFHAVLALAAERQASGRELAAALLVAYETASRFGRAVTLRPGTHPHGNWGVAGAAAGCARLLGQSPGQIAAAIDTGAGLAVAGPFAAALDGNPVRDAWIGASNVSGLVAARMSKAGLARNTGLAGKVFGEVLGSFDASKVDEDLASRWDISLGYFKQHASCSFTHPAADIAVALRDELGGQVRDLREVLVETHTLAAGLNRTSWDSQLAAMFSTPFVVAAALIHGRVGPEQSGDALRDDPEVHALAQLVRVVHADDLTARLPDERATRLTARTVSEEWVREVPNPVGDAAFHPFGHGEVIQRLEQWMPEVDLEPVLTFTADLANWHNVAAAMAGLAQLSRHE